MIDFLKYRVVALVFFLSMIALFAGAYVYRGGFAYSVEFEGGTQVLFGFDKPVKSNELVSSIEKQWPGASAREFSDHQILIRVKESANDTRGLADRMLQVVKDSLPGTVITVEKSEMVGPGVGADLRWKSIRAVLLSLILMLFYIGWRFRSMSFATGAVVALIHDSIMMLGIFLLFGREISVSVIGAILAVLGYSINDTIIIFARIRTNLKEMHGASLYDIVNTSLNQTLRRTLLTSFATFLTVMSMFLLGGEALRDFSLALLAGIFFGTYSSIYMASPVMMLLYKEEKK
jgi:preprotein translocase subunit SecF